MNKKFKLMSMIVEGEENKVKMVDLDNIEDIYSDVEKLVETIHKIIKQSVKQVETITIDDEMTGNTFSNVTIDSKTLVSINKRKEG